METAITVILTNIQDASAGLVPILYGLFVAAGLDTLSGLWAAYNSGTLTAKYVPEFITSHIIKKIVPIFLTLLAGVAVGGTSSAAGLALVATGAASGAAYLASVVAGILHNVQDGNAGTKGVPSSVEVPTLQVVPLTDVASPDEV